MSRITALTLTVLLSFNISADADDKCFCSVEGISGKSGACKDVDGSSNPYETISTTASNEDDGVAMCEDFCAADPECKGYAWFRTLDELNCKLYDFVPELTKRRGRDQRNAVCFGMCDCPITSSTTTTTPTTTTPPTTTTTTTTTTTPTTPTTPTTAKELFQPKRYNVGPDATNPPGPEKDYARAGKCRLSGCDRNNVCRGPLINRGGGRVDDDAGTNYQKGAEGCAQLCLDKGLEEDGSSSCESFNYIFGKTNGSNCSLYKGFPNDVLGWRPGSTRVDFTDYYCYTASLWNCVGDCGTCPPGNYRDRCPAVCADPTTTDERCVPWTRRPTPKPTVPPAYGCYPNCPEP